MGLMDWLFQPGEGGGRVDGARARALVDGGAALVDVRTHVEFSGGHPPGALNIPVSELHERLAEVPSDGPVIVYCRSGSRSARAAHLLRRSGFEEVYDLGPMSAY